MPSKEAVLGSVTVTTFASFVPQLTPRNFLPFETKQFNAYYERFRAKVTE